MRIRRKFKTRKYAVGGAVGGCPDGQQKDQFGNCVDIVPDFTSGIPKKEPQNPAGTGTVLRPPAVGTGTVLRGQDTPLGPNEIMLDPAKLDVESGIESDADKLKRIEEEADMMALEDTTNAIGGFTNDLAAEQKKIDEQGSRDFNMMLEDANYERNQPKEDPIENQEQSKLFNPYAGVDIPTAAYIAGEAWKKDEDGKRDMKKFIPAAGKFLLGSARNFMSGMGGANRNAQQTEEYNKKMRAAQLSNEVALKEGGVIKSDIDAIFDGIDLPMMEEGGEVDIDLLTGNYAKGTNLGDENVELEDGEYLQEPDGTPKKVEGKTHEQEDEDGTGEKMNLPDGTEVISNALKPNAEQRKSISAEYGIKVRAKDTYANTLEKYHKKIGLYDLIEEEEDIIAEVKKQKEKMAEKGADEATSNINLEFLSSKLKDIGDEKIELEKMAQTAFNNIFKMQEDLKPKDETMDQEEFEVGGKVYSKDQIVSVANKYGLSEEKAIDIIKKMKLGGPTGDPGKGTLVTEAEAKKKVASGEWEDLGRGRYIKKGEPGTEFITTESRGRLDSYRKVWEEEGRVDKNVYSTYDEFVNAAEDYWAGREKTTKGSTPGTPDERFYTELKGVKAFKAGVQDVKPEFELPSIDDLKNYVPYDQREKEDGTKPAKPIDEVEAEVEKEKKKQASNALLLPENMPLPPQGLQMPTRFTRRYGRMDLQAVSPDQRLAEVDRAFDAASEQIQNLPSGQKEAALLKLTANTQNKKDEIINAYNVQENQLNQSEEAFNIRQGDREEDARIVDGSRFQDQASAAMANTEDDNRRFYNTVQERNIQNFNTINSLNLLNQAYDNFDFGNEGVDFTGGAGSLEEMLASAQFDQAVRSSVAARMSEEAKKAKEVEEAKAKTKTAKRGGRIKRKY